MELLERADAITVYKRGHRRAPHKSLYLLLLIGKLRSDDQRLHPFREIQGPLSEAIRRFGPNASSVHPEYPFWRLQHDHLAEVVFSLAPDLTFRRSNTDPTRSSLIKCNAKGGLLQVDFDLLNSDLTLQSALCHRILDNHFPASIHEDILSFFGIDLATIPRVETGKGAEDFRIDTLRSYHFKCAISGFSSDAEVGHAGLESADIIWRNHGGSSTAPNGISMTTLHRKLFHLGLFTVTEDFEIRVSRHVRSGEAMGLIKGRKIDLPSNAEDFPSRISLNWHHRWVFRG